MLPQTLGSSKPFGNY